MLAEPSVINLTLPNRLSELKIGPNLSLRGLDSFVSSAARQNAFWQSPGELASRILAEPFGVAARALGLDLEALGAVGPQHLALECKTAVHEAAEARDRRPAGAFELGKKGAFGRKRCESVGVRDRR